jgi:tetratricopeptide (TPR) repeat protein
LIVLRTAQALAAAKVPSRRITSSVKELRRRLPGSALSGLKISADADGVVVREGARRWLAESGQYLLGFSGEEHEKGARDREAGESEAGAGAAESAKRRGPGTMEGAEDWFERGVALEGEDRDAAIASYERAVALDPALLKARINLGCLLHETGRLERAEGVYRDAMRDVGGDPVLLFDLGVLLDDMGRKNDAAEAYGAALREDPRFADCHFNLALLCERLGKPKDAIQHLAAYRRLTATTRSE